jgi:excisionase family DNA binding protein
MNGNYMTHKDRAALLTVAEAAEELRVSRRTVQRLIARGEVPHVRIGRRPLLRSRDLDALIERSTRRSAR